MNKKKWNVTFCDSLFDFFFDEMNMWFKYGTEYSSTTIEYKDIKSEMLINSFYISLTFNTNELIVKMFSIFDASILL